jgi:acyl-CoA thioesterase FadM
VSASHDNGFSAAYRVRFDEAGPTGVLRTSGLLRYAQDVAWQHSEALGFDRAWYGERGLTWLVRGAEIGVRADAPMGTSLDVSTEVLGYRKVWARRRSEVLLPDGSLAAWVHTDWLLIDGSGRPTRIPVEISHVLSAPVIDAALARVDPGDPPATALVRRHRVRRQELDPLRHVNNAVYVDWLEEALVDGGPGSAGAGGEGVLVSVPRNYRLEYLAAAEPGAELEVVAWPAGLGWAVIIRDRQTVMFRAMAGRSPQ